MSGIFVQSFAPVCCDWMSFVHTYSTPVEPVESGRIFRVDRDGVIEWESQTWDELRHKSSDTSLRVRCDGRTLRGTGNIGRYGRSDNLQGLSVSDCVEKWRERLSFFGFCVEGFGQSFQRVVDAPCIPADSPLFAAGTTLTRVDLAGNFEVSDYASLVHALSVVRIGTRLPEQGKYGPTWGYHAKRSNWWKCKVYDKTAELAGKRRSQGGATVARLEVQLGSEWLKREGLARIDAWRDSEMANVVYGRFAEQAFREQSNVSDWSALPPRLQHWATLWREGVDVRSRMSQATYYRVRRRLLDSGLDIGVPCNVQALTRHIRVIDVLPVSALLREAA